MGRFQAEWSDAFDFGGGCRWRKGRGEDGRDGRSSRNFPGTGDPQPSVKSQHGGGDMSALGATSTAEVQRVPEIADAGPAAPTGQAPDEGPSAQTISPHQVRLFRKRALDNGYPLARLRSTSKIPSAPDWQHGESPELLLDVQVNALNTGLLLAGLQCIDCDIDDPQVTLEVVREARRHLSPGALIRRRAGSPRLAMFYRAATGQPSKRVIKGSKGKIEILGRGQQAMVHGRHPSGVPITWRSGRGPDTVPLDQVPEVSEEQITAFLDGSAPLLQPPFVGSNDHEPYKEKVLPLLV